MCPPDRLSLDLNQAVSARRRKRGLRGGSSGERIRAGCSIFSPPLDSSLLSLSPSLTHPVFQRLFPLLWNTALEPHLQATLTSQQQHTSQLSSAESCFDKPMHTIQQHFPRIRTERVKKKKGNVQKSKPNTYVRESDRTKWRSLTRRGQVKLISALINPVCHYDAATGRQ